MIGFPAMIDQGLQDLPSITFSEIVRSQTDSRLLANPFAHLFCTGKADGLARSSFIDQVSIMTLFKFDGPLHAVIGIFFIFGQLPEHIAGRLGS